MWRTGNMIALASLFALLCILMSILSPVDSSKGMQDYAEEFTEVVEELETYATDNNKVGFSEDLSDIAGSKIYQLETEEYVDVEFWRTFNYRLSHPVVTMTLLAMMGMTLTNIYTVERVSNLESIIGSSTKKYDVLYAKLILGITLPVLVYMAYLIVIYLVTLVQYGLPMNGNLQAIRIVKFPLLLKSAYSIRSYISFKVTLMIMVMASLGVTAVLVSFFSKTSIQSIGAYATIIFLGKLLLLLKWLPKTTLLFLTKLNYLDLLMGFDQFVLIYSGKMRLFSMDIDIFNACIFVLAALFTIKLILSEVIINRKM